MTAVGPESINSVASMNAPDQAGDFILEQDASVDQPPAEAFVDAVDTAPLADVSSGLPVPDMAPPQLEPTMYATQPETTPKISGHLPAINTSPQPEPEAVTIADTADKPVVSPDREDDPITPKAPEQVPLDPADKPATAEQPTPPPDTTPNRQTSVAQTQPAIGQLAVRRDAVPDPDQARHEPDSTTARAAVTDKTTEYRETGDHPEAPAPFDRTAYLDKAVKGLRNAKAVLRQNAIEPAPHFRSRIGLAISSLHSLEQNNSEDLDGMRYLTGDYGSSTFSLKPFGSATEMHELDHVLLLEHYIKEGLDKQLETGDTRPVIALDIGGGRGFSWCVLAELFTQEIHKGKVILVVSNLINEPEDFPTLTGFYSSYPSATTTVSTPFSVRPYREVLEETQLQQGVHFVRSPFATLPDVTLPLVDGGSLRLKDNVWVVNEIKSMSGWSRVPEYDIPEALRVLAPGGQYLVGNEDLNIGYLSLNETEGRDRREGIRIAHRVLKQRGIIDNYHDYQGSGQWHIFNRLPPENIN